MIESTLWRCLGYYELFLLVYTPYTCTDVLGYVSDNHHYVMLVMGR